MERQAALAAVKARWPAFEYAPCAAGEPGCDSTTLNVGEDLMGSTVGGGGQARTVPVKTLDELVAEFQALPGLWGGIVRVRA